jgi:zinc-ribbon domain
VTTGPTRCPTCQTLRPPNASYCPNCGTPFSGGRPPAPIQADDGLADLLVPRPERSAVDFSVWAGLKLGAGFVIGASLVILLFWVVVAIFVALGLTAWRM